MKGEKVVLAFSGGLDTSYSVLALRERGFEVHAAYVDTGGVDAERKAWIRERALSLGAEYHELDGGAELWRDFVVPLVWSGGRVLDRYPMLCSDRYVIVRRCLALCEELDTRHFAHGCTAMGNDQLRFDQSVRSLGDFRIHAPIRELQRSGIDVRAHEVELLAGAGVEVPGSTGRYSINENLLGVTVSGAEVDDFAPPGPDTRIWCRSREDWPEEPGEARVAFERGEAVGLDGERLAGPEILARLNRLFASYGVGRHVYTGDVVIGLKGRIVFECPGVEALITAHRALEDAVNTRLQNQFRHVVAARWAELVYGGFFFEPHRVDLEAYLESAQAAVEGEVLLRTEGASVEAVAVDSPYLLADPDAIYARSANWTPEEAEGFVKLVGGSSALAARVRRRRG